MYFATFRTYLKNYSNITLISRYTGAARPSHRRIYDGGGGGGGGYIRTYKSTFAYTPFDDGGGCTLIAPFALTPRWPHPLHRRIYMYVFYNMYYYRHAYTLTSTHTYAAAAAARPSHRRIFRRPMLPLHALHIDAYFDDGGGRGGGEYASDVKGGGGEYASMRRAFFASFFIDTFFTQHPFFITTLLNAACVAIPGLLRRVEGSPMSRLNNAAKRWLGNQTIFNF